MHRIDTKYVAESPPAPAEIETFPGWFQGGDPENETPGTVVGPDWCNAVQEELLAVAAESGEEPNKADNTQVLKGVKEIVKQSPEVKSAIAAAQAAADEAGAARTAASQAKNQAAEAEALAEAADQKAGEANTKAGQALAVAGQSSGAYWVYQDAVDGDAFFPTPGNYYLTGDLSNFPLPGPLWFKNEHSEDAGNPGRPSAVTYTVWNAASPMLRRLGSVDWADPDHPAVTWAKAWETIGSGGGGGFNTRQVITTSGTFTAPVTGWYKITCIGAGGAGGNGETSVAGGGGGGGGAGYVAAAYIYLTAGQAIPVTIGAGSVGSNGGATSFGSLLIVNGGVKGVNGASAMGGIGGAGQCKGSPGGNGFSSGTSTGGLGGDGGNNGTDFGSGGGGGGGGGGTIQPQGGSGQANGDNGVKPAGTTGGTGGKGGDGAIEIEYNDPLKSAE